MAGIMAITKVAALAYLMFNLYTSPCLAAIGAMNAEMKRGKWVWGGIGLQLGVGFTVAYLVYTIGTLITAPATLNIGAALAGLAAVIAVVVIVSLLRAQTKKKMKTEYALFRREPVGDVGDGGRGLVDERVDLFPLRGGVAGILRHRIRCGMP